MLVLSRRVGEKIYIGNDITIMLTNIRRGKCEIGVEAPRSVEVLRQEVKDKRDAAEQAKNAQGPATDDPGGENGKHPG